MKRKERTGDCDTGKKYSHTFDQIFLNPQSIKAIKLQYCSQASAHHLSSILMGSGSQLKVDSVFRLSEVSQMSTKVTGGQSVVCITML